MKHTELSLLEHAETLLCNALPMDHCPPAEWDRLVSEWRDQLNTLKTAGSAQKAAGTPGSQVFMVQSRRGDGYQEERLTDEYYVASHIGKVIEKLQTDLADAGVEVARIQAVAPVVAILG